MTKQPNQRGPVELGEAALDGATGGADASYAGIHALYQDVTIQSGSTGSSRPGTGFLKSTDSGGTWQ